MRNSECGGDESPNAEVVNEGSECRNEKRRNAQVGSNSGGNGYDGKRDSGFAELKRVEVPTLTISERIEGFAEVELCFSTAEVKEETHRCLQCDLEICLAKEKRAGGPSAISDSAPAAKPD